MDKRLIACITLTVVTVTILGVALITVQHIPAANGVKVPHEEYRNADLFTGDFPVVFSKPPSGLYIYDEGYGTVHIPNYAAATGNTWPMIGTTNYYWAITYEIIGPTGFFFVIYIWQ